MRESMITFRSVTPAQRAEGVLKRANIRCSLQRTPRQMEEQGCGYSLRLPDRHLILAAELLREHTIAFRKLYVMTQSGQLEEVQL